MASELRKIRRVIWSPKAEKQWDKILLFYCRRNGSNTYSLKLDDEIHDTLQSYCDESPMGQNTKRKGIRRTIVARRFAAFYRFNSESLTVISVVDARRNVPLD